MEEKISIDGLSGITAEVQAFREQGLDINVEMSMKLITQLALGIFLALLSALLIAGFITR